MVLQVAAETCKTALKACKYKFKKVKITTKSKSKTNKNPVKIQEKQTELDHWQKRNDGNEVNWNGLNKVQVESRLNEKRESFFNLELLYVTTVTVLGWLAILILIL